MALLGPGSVSPPGPPPAHAGTVPSGFTETTVISGLTNPTVVRFASDGRVFVAEKSGLIKVFDDLQDTTPTVFADLRTNVHNFWDRGLLGMTLHPGFPDTPYVYVLYTHDAAIGGTAPRWGTAGATSDGCPTPPGPTTDGCVVSGRLSRLQANGNVMTGGEQVLVEDWCSQYPSHSVGTVEFGPDGMLYASAGDGASFAFVDYGQDGSPVNPCGDPGGSSPTPPTAEGGALRSQDVRTTADPTGLGGSIIRVDPATGNGLSGNPFGGSSDANARRITAYGFRNPFRFAFRPGSEEMWIGDVGWNDFEEIDRILDPNDAVAENFGWPCYEGHNRQTGYDSANLNLCETLYNDPQADTKPFFAYHHNNKVVPGESCPTGSSSVSGLAFEFAPVGSTYPEEYRGALFFADYSRDCIWAMVKGGNPIPAPGQIRTFVAGASNPVNLEFGPNGDLFYVDFDGGAIVRVQHTGSAPTGTLFAAPTSYPTGTNAHGVTTADLNADGKLDLAVANATSNNVSVLLGNGSGGFGGATNFTVGTFPKAVSAADVTGDGAVDLITANQNSSSVSVLRGNGNGTFAAATNYPVCSAAHEVAIGNFNRDSRPDIAVACFAATTVSVLLGTGNGNFGTAINSTAGSAPHSLVAWDFNRDGTHDLAVANRTSSNVSMLRGLGTGSFAAPVNYAVGTGPHSIRTGDFNGDGVVDLATANDVSNDVSVLLGASNGTFSAAAQYPTGPVPKGIGVGDFNGDGKRDLVTANTAGNYPSGAQNPGGDQVSVLLGNGSGGFGPRTNYLAGNTPFAVTVGQFNSDGQADLATANWFGNNTSVLLNTTTPSTPGGATHYLSDIAWITATNGWGPVERDMSNGESTPLDGVTITLNGTTFAKGLGTHSASDVRYSLTGLGTPCNRFKAQVGIDDEVGALGSVVFEVYADATKVYDSGVMTGTTATRSIDVSVAGASQLRLVVTNGGDSISSDHADWADARIECGGGGGDTTPPTITARTPAPGATGVATDVSPTATFSEALNAATVTTSTFTLVQQGQSTPLPATVSYSSQVATLDPSANLLANTTYTATVKGGASGVKDLAGNALASDVSWSFTTGTTQGTVTYVSDMTFAQATNGWGPVERDRSNGESQPGDGATLTLNGTTYAKGLGVHAVSDVRVNLPAGCARFKALVGMDDEVGALGSVVFEVYAGATEIYDSGVMTGTTATRSIDVSIAGASQLRLVVTNGGDNINSDHGDWADARIECGGGGGNQAPVPVIDTPASSLTWKVGDPITFSGHATDPEQGALPASALSWELLLQHCPSNCHTHSIQSWPGVSGGSFAAPDHEYPSYLDLKLTATDAQGTPGSVTLRLDPQTVVLNFGSTPSGLQLAVNATSSTTPFSRTVIVGSSNSLSAPSPQSLSGQEYVFSSWSDGGSQTHNITAPASSASYVATYQSSGSAPSTYISDMTFTQATNGWGPVERDRSNGESDPGDGVTLTLNGTTYPKGLGTHAASDVRVALAPDCTRFKAEVGVDDEVGPLGSVVFEVYAGATKVYDSGVMSGTTATRSIDVSVAGASELRLVVTNGGDNINSDHGDWANARIECGGGGGDTTPPTITARTPSPGATGVPIDVSPTATFSEAMNAATLTTSTFTLVQQGSSTPLPATVSYASQVATLDPSANLQSNTTYTATVKGGSSGAKDVAGNALVSDVSWSFTTGTTQGTVTYISDMTFTQATNGWGPVERDRSNGESDPGDGVTLTLNGTTYPKGLGTHAASDVRVALAPDCTRFKAEVGVDDEVGPLGSVVFEVYAGATKVYDSGVMSGTTATRSIDVSVAGASELRLVVTNGGDNINSDHGDWANARIEC